MRLLLVAAGVILMISGCNGLLSSAFGTHRLRSLTAGQVAGGVGDADYLHITDGRIIDTLTWNIQGAAGDVHRFYPVFGSGQRPVAIGWTKNDVSAPAAAGVFGTVETPSTDTRLPERWQAAFPNQATYTFVHLSHRPLAWYWQLSLFLGGLLLALGTEYYLQLRKLKNLAP